MLSRIADSLFWLNRYVERTDGILRALEINSVLSLDQHSGQTFSWRPTLKVFTNLPDEVIDIIQYNNSAVLEFMITDKANAYSLHQVILKARENARGMQDHLSKEVWECTNSFYLKINDPSLIDSIREGRHLAILSDLIDSCHLYFGVSDVTTARNQGWNYMNLGRYLERAIQTIDIIDIKFKDIEYNLDNASDILYWKNLLFTVSGYELYLKAYRSGIQSQNIVDMMILNNSFPRSVIYCLRKLQLNIQNLNTFDRSEQNKELEKIIGRLYSRVLYSDIETISKAGLHVYLSTLRTDLLNFGNILTKKYFSYF